MTQFDYDLICKLIQTGAPALAQELIEKLAGMVTTANEALRERDELKAELERRDADCEEPCTCDSKCSTCDEKVCEVAEG